jgi:1,4-alpha-glucan branching enzyme
LGPVIDFGQQVSRDYVQPFVIALYTASGIPMLWQGQELSDNYVLANEGNLRVHFRRDMHWEYFYDPSGSPLIRFQRILGQLRAKHRALRGRDTFYYNQSSRTSAGIIVYRRAEGQDRALVFLNFSDASQSVTIPFPSPGTYREQIDAQDRPTPLDIAARSGRSNTTKASPVLERRQPTCVRPLDPHLERRPTA